MSRIGKKLILVPKGVEVQISPRVLQAKGPLGSLSLTLHPLVSVKKEGEELLVALQHKTAAGKRPVKEKFANAIWGMSRAMISTLVQGVSVGFTKQLELQGVGYRVALKGQSLDFSLGFSHPVSEKVPQGIQAKVEKDTKITLTSIDKALLGEFAARLRALRPPDVYQGKGVRYVGEIIKLKAGKSAASTTGGSGAAAAKRA